MQIKLGKIDLAEYAPEWDTSFRPDGELEIIIAKGAISRYQPNLQKRCFMMMEFTLI